MAGKTAVSVLQEYCAKNKLIAPTYNFVSSDNGFVCTASMESCTADGVGRSKSIAKHAAAANVIQILKLGMDTPDIDKTPQTPVTEIMTTDMFTKLRDYCIQNDHPLPRIEIIEQSGTSDAPVFTVLCQVASIKRYGSSNTKEEAKQIAATEMLNAIIDTKKRKWQKTILFDDAALNLECERTKKFETYRKLKGIKSGEVKGVLLCERHNYFSKYHDDIKREAWRVINSTHYASAKEQANNLLKALKLKAKYSEVKTLKFVERTIMIELDCEYDVVLVNAESKIHEHLVQYFKDMLQ